MFGADGAPLNRAEVLKDAAEEISIGSQRHRFQHSQVARPVSQCRYRPRCGPVPTLLSAASIIISWITDQAYRCDCVVVQRMLSLYMALLCAGIACKSSTHPNDAIMLGLWLCAIVTSNPFEKGHLRTPTPRPSGTRLPCLIVNFNSELHNKVTSTGCLPLR